MNNFCTNLVFSRSARYILFFKDGRFFLCDFFLVCFHRSPLNFSRNETFCEHKGLFWVFGTMRLTGDLDRKKSSFFSFLKGFRLRKMGFCCFRLRKMVFQSFVYTFGFLCGAVKLMKILTILSFYHWLSV